MRIATRFVVCFILLPLLCSATLAQGGDGATSPTQRYLYARREFPPTPQLTPQILSRDPNAYRGATLELEGRLSGIVRKADGSALLMLIPADGDPLNLTVSLLPVWVQNGMRLRVLVAVLGAEEGQIQVGTPDLSVVALASADEVQAEEEAWQAQSARWDAQSQKREAGLRAARDQWNRESLAARSGRVSRSTVSPVGSPRSRLNSYLSERAKAIYPFYKNFIVNWNKKLSDVQADAIAASILLYSEQFDIDPRLMVALVIAESDFRPQTTSHKGAMGLGQLMPDEVKRLKLTNPYDPVQNIAGSAFLLKERLNRYSGSGHFEDATMRHIILALASYNAGMGAVKKYKGVPPYKETRNYVKKIERIYRQLCGGDSNG